MLKHRLMLARPPQVASVEDFSWQSRLRYYWEGGALLARMLNALAVYGAHTAGCCGAGHAPMPRMDNMGACLKPPLQATSTWATAAAWSSPP